MSTTIGLDVGGAHLKVAVLEDGKLTSAHQIVCPLWQGLDKLDTALEQIQDITSRADRVAITMTGELSDLFRTREEGVTTLVDRLDRAFKAKAHYWMAAHGFGTAADTKRHHTDVGSTNFLATALSTAHHAPNALLIDIGSTTTDIIPIINAKPCPRGLTDARRLESGELVYTGLTRTPVMAVTNHVPYDGQWQTLAREYLATMADVHRLLGQLPDGVDLHATADGHGKSFDESLNRFARMLGRDIDITDITSETKTTKAPAIQPWLMAARHVAEQQMRSIHDGALQVLSAHPNLTAPKLITAGIGSHLAATLANRLGLAHTSFGALAATNPKTQRAATHNAPAVAVALLLAR